MQNDSAPLYPSVNPQNQQVMQFKDGRMHGPSSAPQPTMPQVPHQILGPENTETVCHFCNAHIKTAVKYTTTARTHMAAALCGLLCCCCCIPYSSDSAKNSDHYCPKCDRYLGTYQK